MNMNKLRIIISIVLIAIICCLCGCNNPAYKSQNVGIKEYRSTLLPSASYYTDVNDVRYILTLGDFLSSDTRTVTLRSYTKSATEDKLVLINEYSGTANSEDGLYIRQAVVTDVNGKKYITQRGCYPITFEIEGKEDYSKKVYPEYLIPQWYLEENLGKKYSPSLEGLKEVTFTLADSREEGTFPENWIMCPDPKDN